MSILNSISDRPRVFPIDPKNGQHYSGINILKLKTRNFELETLNLKLSPIRSVKIRLDLTVKLFSQDNIPNLFPQQNTKPRQQ